MAHDEELGTDERTVGDLGATLRRLRRRQARELQDTELTYRELAARTGFSYGVVAEYFSGKVLAPTDRFDVIIRLLGATCTEQRALATARDRVEEQRRVPVAGGDREPPSQPVPHELPTDVFGFVGRYDELAALDQLATQAATAVAISAVSGTAGVGKTALAIHWAHTAQDRFPDGCLYVDLRGYGPDEPVTPGEALAMVLRSLGTAGTDIPDGTAERAARLRSRLAGTRTLMILDNARDTDHVRQLLPGTSSCMVVVTSRDGLAGLVALHGARRVDVEALPMAHAVELLVALIGPRAVADPATVATLAEHCAHLPLALRIAAELACSRGYTSLGRLVAELADQYRRLEVLDSAVDASIAIRAVFSWSYRHLPPELASAFRLLGLHPGRHFDTGVLAALTGVDQPSARLSADRLVRASLVQSVAADQFTMHDLLRAYAMERARAELPGPVLRTAVDQLAQWYVSGVRAASQAPLPARRPGAVDSVASG